MPLLKKPTNKQTENQALLEPTFLFRFTFDLKYFDGTWTGESLQLPTDYALPSLCELDGTKRFADVRAAWNESGLFFYVRVNGKRQAPWCRQSRIEDSDGIQVWIDTRDTHNVHRAGRYCHRFALLPAGGGR